MAKWLREYSLTDGDNDASTSLFICELALTLSRFLTR